MKRVCDVPTREVAPRPPVEWSSTSCQARREYIRRENEDRGCDFSQLTSVRASGLFYTHRVYLHKRAAITSGTLAHCCSGHLKKSKQNKKVFVLNSIRWCRQQQHYVIKNIRAVAKTNLETAGPRLHSL